MKIIYTSVRNSAKFHNFLSHIVKIIHKKCFFSLKKQGTYFRINEAYD